MEGNAPKSHITGAPGWEHYDEQELLFKLATALADDKEALIVEIGGEFGMSASIFSKAAPKATIYSIDVVFGSETGRIHEANLKEAGVGKNVIRIAADSHDKSTLEQVNKLAKGDEIDLLFIDGDHSYGGALLDLNLWTPLVKVGGKVAIHDNACITNTMPHPLHYQVSQAVAKWISESAGVWAQVEMVYSTLVFQRIGAKLPTMKEAVDSGEIKPTAPKGKAHTPIETDVIDGDLVPKTKATGRKK